MTRRSVLVAILALGAPSLPGAQEAEPERDLGSPQLAVTSGGRLLVWGESSGLPEGTLVLVRIAFGGVWNAGKDVPVAADGRYQYQAPAAEALPGVYLYEASFDPISQRDRRPFVGWRPLRVQGSKRIAGDEAAEAKAKAEERRALEDLAGRLLQVRRAFLEGACAVSEVDEGAEFPVFRPVASAGDAASAFRTDCAAWRKDLAGLAAESEALGRGKFGLYHPRVATALQQTARVTSTAVLAADDVMAGSGSTRREAAQEFLGQAVASLESIPLELGASRFELRRAALRELLDRHAALALEIAALPGPDAARCDARLEARRVEDSLVVRKIWNVSGSLEPPPADGISFLPFLQLRAVGPPYHASIDRRVFRELADPLREALVAHASGDRPAVDAALARHEDLAAAAPGRLRLAP